MEWHIIGILAFVVIYNIYRYYHEDDSYEYCPVTTSSSDSNQVIETNMEETINTRQLAFSTIEHIGSEPKYTEEGRIQFEYQGVIFLMEAANDCMFVNLIWPWCHSFSKFDIDEFARVRQVVNDINARGTVTVFYGITDSDEVAIHIKKNLLFIAQINDLEDYLKAMLESFFRTARTLDVEIEKCRLQECER
ncbi:MAG: hypothetical protein J5965_09960 [Aeriscardovia sp.]|nr:hypothetical protein [Aeriscardovia sp.]MBO6255964.1 hypothetical protein [Bacteroidaceae bacterium]